MYKCIVHFCKKSLSWKSYFLFNCTIYELTLHISSERNLTVQVWWVLHRLDHDIKWKLSAKPLKNNFGWFMFWHINPEKSIHLKKNSSRQKYYKPEIILENYIGWWSPMRDSELQLASIGSCEPPGRVHWQRDGNQHFWTVTTIYHNLQRIHIFPPHIHTLIFNLGTQITCTQNRWSMSKLLWSSACKLPCIHLLITINMHRRINPLDNISLS